MGRQSRVCFCVLSAAGVLSSPFGLRPPPPRSSAPPSSPASDAMAEQEEEFYVRYYVGHKGKFGHEFLEFEFRPDGRLRYANNSNYKNDVMIRKECYVTQAVMRELRKTIEDRHGWGAMPVALRVCLCHCCLWLKSCSTLRSSGQHLTKIYQLWSNVSRFWSNSATHGQTCQFWSMFANC